MAKEKTNDKVKTEFADWSREELKERIRYNVVRRQSISEETRILYALYHSKRNQE